MVDSDTKTPAKSNILLQVVIGLTVLAIALSIGAPYISGKDSSSVKPLGETPVSREQPIGLNARPF